MNDRKEGFDRRTNSAASERFGMVVVYVYANRGRFDDLVFKVEMVRLYSSPAGIGETHNFETLDLIDAIKSLYWARRWIAKTEKKLKRGSMWPRF
ncbi:hypothetical protein EP7_004263 [Isosphaeraceae bacterium EP7]